MGNATSQTTNNNNANNNNNDNRDNGDNDNYEAITNGMGKLVLNQQAMDEYLRHVSSSEFFSLARNKFVMEKRESKNITEQQFVTYMTEELGRELSSTYGTACALAMLDTSGGRLTKRIVLWKKEVGGSYSVVECTGSVKVACNLLPTGACISITFLIAGAVFMASAPWAAAVVLAGLGGTACKLNADTKKALREDHIIGYMLDDLHQSQIISFSDTGAILYRGTSLSP